MYYRPAESHSFFVRITVLTKILRSHSKTQNHHYKLTSYTVFFPISRGKPFHAFKNKNNPK